MRTHCIEDMTNACNIPVWGTVVTEEEMVGGVKVAVAVAEGT